MDNLDFMMSCFNQYCFQDAKNGIEDIEYYLTTNPSTQGNQLISEFVYAIKNYSFETIDIPLFQAICTKCCKTEAESRDIMGRLVQWKTYSKDKIAPTKQFIKDIIANSIIQRANRLYSNSPSEFLNYLKKSEIKTTTDAADLLTTSTFDSLDINSLVASEDHCGVESYFPFFNRTFAPFNVVEYGQLICVSMPPGTGKSLWSMTEALYMASKGEKVHYLALGDLKISDFIIRMAAIYSGLPFWEARKNIAGIYKSLSKIIGNNLGITCIPSGKITVDEYIDYIKTTDYKILYCDYDAGFLNPEMGDSMYLSMGNIYDKLTELTAMGKLVYILAQPMKASWDLEAIELNQVGESAKKIQICDCLITRGRCVESPNHMGIVTIAKNRRGEEGVKAYTIRLNNGRFRVIPKQVYDELKRVDQKVEWTDGDIDSMIDNYEKQHAKINSYVQKASVPTPNVGAGPVQTQQVQFKGPNPFMGKV